MYIFARKLFLPPPKNAEYFFEALDKAGYKWNARKLELTKKEVKWIPEDGDFLYQKDDVCAWVSILKEETGREDNKLDVYASFVISSNNNSGLGLKTHGKCRKVTAGKTYRLATDSEKQLLLDALAKEGKTWNAEKKRVEKVLWRAERNGIYWFTNSCGFIISEMDLYSEVDDLRYNAGDYFQTESECEEYIERIKAVLDERKLIK